MRSTGRKPVNWASRAILLFSVGIWLLSGTPIALGAAPTQPEDPIPLLAYYYIWFDPGSWDRAKTDYPVLGRYSSEDDEVMRQHVDWAKQVGIDGFIVSWKSTERLNPRLELLIGIAEEMDFKLAIIYQGLDFERDPLPVDQIGADLGYFLENFAHRSPFDLFERPLVIWSGTWEFSPEEIQQVTSQHRDQLLILASEREAEDYLAIARLVDGNAYYWSSVDPDRFPGYQDKLDRMGEAVHQNRGLWIAPAAPGFDARLIEGTRVIERQGGGTLVKELNAAYASSPDAVGLISWNEFSENTHIEPSRNYGMRSLEILAEHNQTGPPEVIEFDSSEPAETLPEANPGRLVPFALMGGLVLLSLMVILWRSRMEDRGS